MHEKGRPTMQDLLVSSNGTDSVLCYDGTRGRFRGAFVPKGSGGLKLPQGLCFGPDGKLYVSSFGTGQVLRYNGDQSKVFTSGGGLGNPAGLVFGPDGNLYVADFAGTNRVLRYDGVTGAFDRSFLSGPDIGIVIDLRFGPDGNLYVAGNGTGGGPLAGVFRYNGSSGLFDKAFVPDVAAAGLGFGPDQNRMALLSNCT
jgi:DNA-binding beta-propeller fold protein YncE